MDIVKKKTKKKSQMSIDEFLLDIMSQSIDGKGMELFFKGISNDNKK